MSDAQLPADQKLPRGGMSFAFILSMPGRNSWNGRWSGEDKVYARVKTFTAKAWKERLSKLVGHHSYNFGDGWCACVEVQIVSKEQKRNLLKRSAGFCGYDWMIDTLIHDGRIHA